MSANKAASRMFVAKTIMHTNIERDILYRIPSICRKVNGSNSQFDLTKMKRGRHWL